MTTTTDISAELIDQNGVQNPYPIYRRLRESSPVYWSDSMNAWLVTGHRAALEAFRSNDRFSNVGFAGAILDRLPDEVRAEVPLVALAETGQTLSTADQPEHTRQRQQIMNSLAPRRLKGKREWVEGLCDELIDELASVPTPDIIEDFGTPLSYRSILDMFGASRDHLPIYMETAVARLGFLAFEGSTPEAAVRYQVALEEFRRTLEAGYADRSGEDDGTIIGSLLNPPDGIEPLSSDELFAILKTFFAAGHENLIFSVATTLYALLTNPEQMAAVADDPMCIVPAFEESVRWDTPNHFNRRVVLDDTDLAGQEVRKGDRIIICKAAANRDPEAWTDPDRFDLHRDQREPEGGTVSFGKGIHFCAGAGVARMEGPTALMKLLAAFPDISLERGWEPGWRPTVGTHMLTALPVRLGSTKGRA